MKKNNIPLNYKERYNSKISFFCSVIVLVILFLIFNQIDYSLVRKPAKEAAEAAAEAKKKAEEEATLPQVTTVDVLAVGDNLYHSSLMASGQYESGQWNYDHIYANVLDEIQAADLAVINQETAFTADHDAISSYPSFATPMEVGDAVVAAGFDIVTSATNHVDDFGYENIATTLDFWKTKHPDTTVLGIHETKEDADTIRVKDVNGIKIAFLNYTYGTNGEGAGEGKEFMIDTFDKVKVAADIQKAKGLSDCVIVSAHWGKEDDTTPTEYEKQWAAFLLQQGVDVVLGSNPHVLQPYGRMYDDQGNSMLIFYSLGNFVTGQESLNKLLGGMAKFTVQKTTFQGVSTVEIVAPELKPVVMHYSEENGEYGPYMLEDYTEELAAQHGVREIIGEEFTLERLNEKFKEIMSMNVKPSKETDLLSGQSGTGNDSDGDSDDGNYEDGSYDDGSYDDGYYDDGSYDDGSYDDGSYDDGSYDDGSYDDGSYNDGSYDDGSYDDGSYDDGSYNDGSYDDGSYDDGSYDDGSYNDGSYDDGSYE